MSNEEYALTIQAGDASALPLLWEQVRRLCWVMVRRYWATAAANKAVDMDDLMQAAFLGLHRATQAYKPEGGAAFNTLLGFYVKSECQALLGLHGRERKEHYTTVSLDTPITSTDGENGGTLGELVEDTSLPGAADALELSDLRREVREAVAQLPEQQAAVVQQNCLQELPMQTVADQMGIDLYKARRLKQKALYTLYWNPRIKVYEPDYYRHKGPTAFNSSWSSVVEDAVGARMQW